MDEQKRLHPSALDAAYRKDSFDNGQVLLNKKKGHLPAMGWNSWNAFGSGNTEALTLAMADKFIELGLDKLGYQYLVLDDGCYKPERVDGKLSNDEVKFPSGFRALADAIHAKGLSFGMYNDIGTNLCAGAAVGTCGYEKEDAASYVDWDIDFIKVDNCYYLWDNATFSDKSNAAYTWAPNIREIRVTGAGMDLALRASEGTLTGEGGVLEEDHVTHIGTFDGTGPERTPIGVQSSELVYIVEVPAEGMYELTVNYAAGQDEGIGAWLQVAVGEGADAVYVYDDLLERAEEPVTYLDSAPIALPLKAGSNVIRLMNHRRQENTLASYAALLEGFNEAKPGHDVLLSICEWGKTQPANWGFKVGDSWRILNDITFQVGHDGDPGGASWECEYTNSLTAQYDKCVIMDEFAGLDKGWNDPDMMMIGMNGMTMDMNRTHMAMWCMMNSPLMLGLDLRRVTKGDELYSIIANEALIALNQDALGIQAKRIFSTKAWAAPDKEYIRDNDRVDILAKPLADGSVALSFINVSREEKREGYAVTAEEIVRALTDKLPAAEQFAQAAGYRVTDLWTGDTVEQQEGRFEVVSLAACSNVTVKVTPV